MEERTITNRQTSTSFELPRLDQRSLGDWAAFGPDRVVWGATFHDNNRYKAACFVHELTGKLIKTLTSPGGCHGPVVGDDHLVFGGGANGATVSVFDRTTLKKVGSLKGHKSQLKGLMRLGDLYVTLGGKNSRPFDDTVRAWDPATLEETWRVKLEHRPNTAVAGADRIYVHASSYPNNTGLYAIDGSGKVLWSRPNGETSSVKLSLSSDGGTLAMVRGDHLFLLGPEGEERGSCSLAEAGWFRMAGTWGAPAFSPDNRWLFLTPEYDDPDQGTVVVDIQACAPVLRLRGVVRPAPFGEGYGAWLGRKGRVNHFGLLTTALIEP